MAEAFLHNEKQILEEVAKGSEPAFRILLDFYRNRVFSHALTYVKVTEEAEEIVQDIFIKVWLSRQKLTEVQDFKNYLFILSRNQLVSAIRKRLREQATVDATDSYADILTADSRLVEQDLQKKIQEAISQLSLQQQSVFMLSRFENLSQDEISTRLGISKRTVKFHMGLALNRLRTFLQDDLLFCLVACYWL